MRQLLQNRPTTKVATVPAVRSHTSRANALSPALRSMGLITRWRGGSPKAGPRRAVPPKAKDTPSFPNRGATSRTPGEYLRPFAGVRRRGEWAPVSEEEEEECRLVSINFFQKQGKARQGQAKQGKQTKASHFSSLS